jgi:arylsulfatase A-like enzyme
METITKRYTEKSIEFIQKEQENPFFLYLPYTMPHVPIDASEKFKGKSDAGLFGDVIEELDWSVGQILEELEKLGIAENTMVIFTSDNGPMIHMNIPRYDPNLIKPWHHGSAGPLRGGKFEVYEGGFRVPGIIQWKGKIKTGQVTSEVMRSIDLKPTIFKLAGVTKHDLAEIDGVNQHSLIFEQGKSATDELLYERNGQKRAFRKGDWKIVLTPQENNKPLIELFNLKNDVQELYDIAGEYPDKVKELINLINDFSKHNTGC